jgi:diaminopropionate ammonia-lyase
MFSPLPPGSGACFPPLMIAECSKTPRHTCHTEWMSQAKIADSGEELRYVLGHHRATRLIDSPGLAFRANVGQIFLKAEWERPLGNFKVLGGMLAGLRALARVSGAASVREMLDNTASHRSLPQLICASDGNHGLAVAAAARRASTKASIYLPMGVSDARIERIEAQGAKVVLIAGTYDDAVEAAEKSAARGEGLLVPDTTRDPDDAVVRDVMEGYSLIASELIEQFRGDGNAQPTHVFVQAGVGGLAAALHDGLAGSMQAPCKWLIVEPASAACVARALSVGRPVRIDGALNTSAEMLSCGLASAPALRILQSAGATSVLVDEDRLLAAVDVLREIAGVETTPSGAAGLAGLLQVASRSELCSTLEIGIDSRVLLLITEGPIASCGMGKSAIDRSARLDRSTQD